MSAPGTIRTRDLGGRNASLCPLSYGGNTPTVDAERLTVEMLPPRMAEKVRFDDTCWIWTAATNSRGYGCVQIDGKRHLAHRIAYATLVGPVPDGLTIDHLCRRQLCINPAHLEPVTVAENLRRKPVREFCPHGHPMSGDNLRTYTRKNGIRQRQCRTCQRAAVRASDARRALRRAPAKP